MLLLFVLGKIPTVVARPDTGVVARPVDPAGATVDRPGGGDIVQRPEAATGAVPSWIR